MAALVSPSTASLKVITIQSEHGGALLCAAVVVLARQTTEPVRLRRRSCTGTASSQHRDNINPLLIHYRLIENKYFETVVLALILLSSAVMTLEDIWFETRPLLMDTLYYLDRILTVVFFLETDLKLFAMGCVMYFGNAWCWLDFVIVAVSLVNFGASLLGAGNIPIFKTMRTLRALRPLRAMAKMEGMKVSGKISSQSSIY